MEIIDPGHRYRLKELDACGTYSTITFVKRCNPPEKYPGNKNSYPGTNIQEVLRALIDRCEYINKQIYSPHTEKCIKLFREAILELELRAAERHGREINLVKYDIENETTCDFCGHIQCGGICQKKDYWKK